MFGKVFSLQIAFSNFEFIFLRILLLRLEGIFCGLLGGNGKVEDILGGSNIVGCEWDFGQMDNKVGGFVSLMIKG